MFENIAAIDIGSSGVRMIKARTGLNNFYIQSLSYENIDISPPNKKEAIVLALRKIITDDPIAGYKIISNLPMETAVIRSITFPFSEPQKIAEALPFEAAENVPFGLDEMALDFNILGGDDIQKGRVLLAAAKKETVNGFVEMFQSAGVTPSYLGLESDSLLACYKRLAVLSDETAIQLHIGNNKSVINIIKNGRLRYTRTCSASISGIRASIASCLKINESEAAAFLLELNPDISGDALKEGIYNGIKPGKQQIKKIFRIITETFEDMREQVQLTIMAYRAEGNEGDIDRILLSGGGANFSGLAAFMSKGTGIPAFYLPFLDGYRDTKTNSIFHSALGMLLAYVDKKNKSINFIKGEFLPDINGKTKKIYSLALFFLTLTAFVFIFSLIMMTITGSSSASKHEKLLQDNYLKYFAEKEIPGDPIASAKEKLKKEEKELDSINAIIGEKISSLELMRDIFSCFGHDPSFELKNLIINENSVRIDGSTSSTQGINNFRDKLQQTGSFDSISINNITSSKNGVSSFQMTIKKKKGTKK